ncbi:MAG: nuclear transport factor 2 family protein, partial [Bacteroidetes bacterium]|nr:nuclear transport factor 2 family protein [Bacteroidota bacterium]
MNNEKKSALNSTYKQFLNAGFKSEGLSLLQKFVVKDVAGYGSTEDEKIQGIAGLKALLRNQKKQAKGMKFTWKTTPFSRYLTADENTAVYADDVYLSIKAGKELIKMYLRFSTVLNYINDQWKVIHWHGSKPEQVQSDADTYGIDNLKQKNAELEKLVQEKTADLTQKNRELEIEAALERVRSRAMAMHTSNELKEVAREMRHQLCLLGQKELETCAIHLWDESSGEFEGWAALRSPDNTGQLIESESRFTFKGIRILEESFQNYQAGKKDYVLINDVAKAKEFFKALKPVDPTAYAFLSPTIKHKKPEDISAYWSVSDFDGGSLVMVTRNLPNENSRALLRRFADVFGLAYRRFSDLKKAEAQAREAQIEAALERVRSRSMAMHKSEELKQVIRVVLDQFVHLKINVGHAGFYIDYKAHDDMHIWLADPNIEPFFAVLPYFDTPTWNSFLEAKAKGITLHTDLLDFKTKNKFYKSLFKLFAIPEEAKEFYLQCKGLAVSTVLLESVGLYIENFDGIPYTDEENNILLRFGKVFQQAYTRFLDLQKAESQAREAQVEAALERVRARTMAMQKSSELNPTADLLFDQLKLLGADLQGVAFAICDKDSDIVQKWTSIGVFSFPYTIEPAERNMYEAWKNKVPLYEEIFEGERIKKYYETLMEVPAFKQGLQKLIDAGVPMPTWQKNHAVAFQQGYLLIITTKPFSETQIFVRFGKVFEQTYTRFLDLQKAEAQSRESQIQLALERVRASTMAMQKSEDLKKIVKVVLRQFRELGFVMEGGAVHIGILNDDSKIYTQWSAEPLLETVDSYNVPYNDNPLFADVLKAKKRGEEFFFQKYSFEEKNKWFDWAFVHSDFKRLPDEFKKVLKECNSYAHWTAFQKNSLITINNVLDKSLSHEQIAILKRFSEVFEQAYTRFLDLQKAEVNAKEAVKQAALDRIRADIAAMRTVSDLERITPLIWNELTILGIPFIRCGVFIMDEEKELIHTFLSTPDGKAIAAVHIPYNTPGKIKQIPQNWRKKLQYTDHWNDPDFTDFADALVQQHAIASADQYLSGVPHGGFYLHFVPFLQGMMYAGNSTKLDDAEINIIQSVADAFSTAYARYEDFNKLEAAKRQVDNALNELQATQKQLIQSEKMASLGELTAGIAHEIQNPLNFVNNFSEVNKEMID